MHAVAALVSLWRTRWRIYVRCQAAAMVPLVSPGMPRLAAAFVPVAALSQKRAL
jgi:hypothetical protein